MFSTPAETSELLELTSQGSQAAAENLGNSAQSAKLSGICELGSTALPAEAPSGPLAQLVAASSLHGEGRPFEPDRGHQTSRQARGPHRKEYMRNYRREWMRQRRATFFAGKTCEHCPATDSLEIHHRDPAQKVAHAIWSWAQARRQAELDKCIALCDVCHKKLTALDAGRRNITSPRIWAIGASGYPNVTWSSQKSRWRVLIAFQQRDISAGHFRNPLTAQMAAERLRSALAKHCAAKRVLSRVACQKQLLLPIAEVHPCAQ